MALSRPWTRFKASTVTWWINREYDQMDLRRRLEMPQKLMAPPAQMLPRDSAPRVTEVARTEWNGLCLYVKRYRQKNVVQTVKDIFRPSRARRAFEFSFVLNERGIPTPLPIAVGEVRAGRRLKESFLISKEIPNARTFFQHRAAAKELSQNRILMRALARTLAKLHDAGFSHSDPNFSNWLICGEPYPNPKLVAIDLDGVRKVGFVTAKGAAKDLYRLVRYMTPYERRWFVAQYSRARTHRLCAHKFDRLCQAYI